MRRSFLGRPICLRIQNKYFLDKQGKAEAIEVVVHGDEHRSDVVGKTIAEINLPDKSVVASVVRGDKVIMASRKLVIQENDHVLLILNDVSRVHQMEQLFEGS